MHQCCNQEKTTHMCFLISCLCVVSPQSGGDPSRSSCPKHVVALFPCF